MSRRLRYDIDLHRKLILFCCAACFAQEPSQALIQAPYVETPDEVVTAMLSLARVGRRDVVYDLGCGDGRIVIAAARDFGARAVGIEINPAHIARAQSGAQAAGVGGRVEFRREDFFETDLAKATVVMLYLLPDVNLELRSKLLRELKPGTRIVSHAFGMGDWRADRELPVGQSRLYYWEVPERGQAPPFR